MLVSKFCSETSKTKAGPGGLVRVALFSKSYWATCPPFVPCDRIVQRAYIEGNGYEARQTSKDQTPGCQDLWWKVHDRAQSFICVHTICMNYVIKTFLLASYSVSSKQLFCIVHGQWHTTFPSINDGCPRHLAGKNLTAIRVSHLCYDRCWKL